MRRLKNIAGKIFGSSSGEELGKGIYASLEELIEQRQYISYVKNHNKKDTYAKYAGDVKSAFKGRGMEFAEIRAYEYGDEVRDIDWRVTARKLAPYTKLYHEEKDREIYVFLDLSSSMVFGTKHELKSVLAAKVAALLGWISFENKDRIGAVIFDGEESYFYKPQNSRANLLAILKKISEMTKQVAENRKKATEPAKFEKSLHSLQKTIKGRANIFVISDFAIFDDKIRKSLALVAKRGRLYLVDVFDKVEYVVPQEGEYMISSNEENLVFNTAGVGFKGEYENYFVHKNQIVKEFCLKFSCLYMGISNEIPIFRQIRL